MSRARRWILSLLLFPAAAGASYLISGCGSSEDVSPTVYAIEVTGTAVAESAYNILFLPAGFEEEDLPAFRRAAKSFAETLAGTPPLADYREYLGFYRMDLAGGAIESDSSCPEDVPLPRVYFFPPIGTSAISASSAAGVEVSYGGLSVYRDSSTGCEVIWLESASEEAAMELALDGPDIQQVVVLANTTVHAGAARPSTEAGSIELAVTGVMIDELPETPGLAAVTGFTVSAAGLDLVIHEVGHGFGLYDEYTSSLYAAKVDYDNDRNLWNPDLAPDTGGLTPDEFIEKLTEDPTVGRDLLCTDIPWRRELSEECADGLRECPSDYSSLPSGQCSYQPKAWVRLCSYDASMPPGLWEGGLYEEEGYFRAGDTCLMSEVGLETPFCEACSDVIEEVLCTWTGGDCTDLEPPEIECAAPGEAAGS